MTEKINSDENNFFISKKRKRSEIKRITAQLFASLAFGMMVLSVGSLLTAPTILNGALYKETSSDKEIEINSTESSLNASIIQELTIAYVYTTTSTPNIDFTDKYQGKSALILNNSSLLNDRELLNITNEVNNTEDIQLTKVQASWLGSVVYVVQPAGSIVSGFIQGHIGRRNGMMATSVVQLIAWISLYFCTNVASLFASAVLMGISIGFMEAPGLSFVGETIEPRYRGSFTNISLNMWLFGVLFEYFLGAVLSWRYVCLASAAIPILNFLILIVIPESPTFLMLQGKERQAAASLKWYRGWTDHEDIKDEYEALAESLNIPHKHNGSYLSPLRQEDEMNSRKTNEKPKGQLTMLCESRVRFPLLLIMLLFLTQHSISLAGPKPFLINIFESLDMKLAPHWILVCSGVLQLIGVLICACVIRWTGKRTMVLISGFSSTVICVLLAIYMYLTPGLPIIPMVLFSINFFLNGLGIMSVPWCLISEVFPTECRGSAAGIAAATSYFLGFIITITYKPIESIISLWGCMLVYAAIGFVGSIIVYFKLPETEGKSLIEIEQLFRKRTECNTPKSPKGHFY